MKAYLNLFCSTNDRSDKVLRTLIAAVVMAYLSGCATAPSDQTVSPFAFPTAGGDQSDMPVDEAEEPKERQIERLEPILDSYEVAAATSAEQLNLSSAPSITATFEKVTLEHFVTHSLANVLEVDFVIDPTVSFGSQTVTLSINEPVSPLQYLEIFADLLAQNKLGIKVQDGLLFLFSSDQQRGRPEYDYGFGLNERDIPVGSRQIFQVLPVSYIDATSLQSFLIRLSNVKTQVLPDPNLLGVHGERQDIIRAIEIAKMLDRPSLRGRHVIFLPLEYIPASDFITQVSALMENEGVNVSRAIRFTELSRQSGVVINSIDRGILDRVIYWRQQLDTPDATDERRYFLYYPKNMEASKLGEVLQKLLGVGGARPQSSGSAGAGESGSEGMQGLSGIGSDFSFVTDENRNAIIIYAAASQYKTMKPLLEQLDVTPPQVLIEARLIEVTLTDQFSQGIDWSLFGGAAKRNQPTAQVAAYGGGSFAYTISGVDYQVALDFLETQDKIKVLSSPRIVVSNGESASIQVGTEIPVLSTQSADVDTDRVLQSIQYRSTGVKLDVTPMVNSSNVVSLKISQNVSETSENSTSGLDSPIILNRSFQTSVVANSGQSLVLGGLIRENNSSDDVRIPGLGRLPGVGRLFSSESRSTSRTELIVLVTPRIINNSSDISEMNAIFMQELTLHQSEDNER